MRNYLVRRELSITSPVLIIYTEKTILDEETSNVDVAESVADLKVSNLHRNEISNLYLFTLSRTEQIGSSICCEA